MFSTRFFVFLFLLVYDMDHQDIISKIATVSMPVTIHFLKGAGTGAVEDVALENVVNINLQEEDDDDIDAKAPDGQNGIDK